LRELAKKHPSVLTVHVSLEHLKFSLEMLLFFYTISLLNAGVSNLTLLSSRI